LLYYCVMVIVVALLTVRRGMQHYGLLTGLDDAAWFGVAGLVVERTAFVIGMFVGPLFTHHLVGGSIDRVRRIAYAGVASSYVVIAAVEFVAPSSVTAALSQWVSLPLLYAMFGYCMTLAAMRLRQVGSRDLGVALLASFAAAIVALPASFYQYMTQQPYLPYFVETPIAFMLVNIGAIIFAYRYLNQAPFLERGVLSAHFKQRFSITEREAEIVALLLQGAPNSAVAEKLFISVRTVESHLYSVFQKTGVKSRLQLVNLIQTNQA